MKCYIQIHHVRYDSVISKAQSGNLDKMTDNKINRRLFYARPAFSGFQATFFSLFFVNKNMSDKRTKFPAPLGFHSARNKYRGKNGFAKRNPFYSSKCKTFFFI